MSHDPPKKEIPQDSTKLPPPDLNPVHKQERHLRPNCQVGCSCSGSEDIGGLCWEGKLLCAYAIQNPNLPINTGRSCSWDPPKRLQKTQASRAQSILKRSGIQMTSNKCCSLTIGL